MYVLIRGCNMLALGFTLLLLVTGELPGVSGDERDCDVKSAETCYKLIVDQALGTDYASATSACNGLGYKIAEIPNLTVQTEIMKFLRQKMPEIKRKNWVRVWIGATINSAGAVTPPIPDGKWYPMFPMRSHRNFQWTNIYLHVNPDPAMKYQGMINTYPNYKTNGVVCQFVPLHCNVRYNKKCFRAILQHHNNSNTHTHDREDVDFNAAQSMCEDIGWKLANIYDADHYTMIVKYLREKIPSSRTYNSAWLGMTINPQSKEMRYSSGERASDDGMKWLPGYPESDSSYTNIGIHIDRDPGSTRQGIHSWPPTPYPRHGAICEI